MTLRVPHQLYVIPALLLAAGGAFAQESRRPSDFGRKEVSDRLVAAVAGCKEPLRQPLRAVLWRKNFRGKLTKQDVDALVALSKLTPEQLMTELLPVASSYSHSPISKFRVGCVVLGKSGSMYFGTNIEVGEQILSYSVHAEQSAITTAYTHGEPDLLALAVTAAPCGHCRQFINELPHGLDIKVFLPGQPAKLLRDLLPESFGPKDLGGVGGPFGVSEVVNVTVPITTELAVLAAKAASRSYAPYSGSYSGVALRASGQTFVGSYIENAAFNPSLSPLQAALVGLTMAAEDYATIEQVVLVEAGKPNVRQRHVTEVTLRTFAPKAKLDVLEGGLTRSK